MTNQKHFKIIRKPEVLNQAGFSRSTLHTKIKAGIFIPPIPLGERAIGFIQSEVDACLAAMIAGQTSDELKSLVADLVAKRQEIWEELK